MSLPYLELSPDELREEIRRRDRRLAAIRKECSSLRRAASATRHKALKDENQRLRKALSYIGHNPEADPGLFRHVAQAALFGAEAVPGEPRGGRDRQQAQGEPQTQVPLRKGGSQREGGEG